MQKHILLGCFAAALSVGVAGAATLSFPDGSALQGLPDTTVGWSFRIASTPILDGGNLITPWLLITFADFVPNAGFNPVGLFTPFITQPPNSNTAIGPNTGNGEINPWIQSFDAALFTGIGSYHINDFQMAGDQVVGTIVLHYDLYRASPNGPDFNPTTDTVAVGQTLSATSSVTVTAVPEPGTGSLLALAGLVWAATALMKASQKCAASR